MWHNVSSKFFVCSSHSRFRGQFDRAGMIGESLPKFLSRSARFPTPSGNLRSLAPLVALRTLCETTKFSNV